MRGTRDPSRHDAATLQAFLDSYDPSKVDIEHAQLCNTVKTAQKDPQLKESWCRWADDESLGQLKGTRDPSRHSKETLKSFLESIGWDLGGSVKAAIPSSQEALARQDGFSLCFF